MSVNKRSDGIADELFNFKVLHGKEGIRHLNSIKYSEIPNVSRDIKVVMITNFKWQNVFTRMYIENPDKINSHLIFLDKPKFRCGIDLIEPLYDYVKTINEKYVLYMDTSDTAILSDILNPQEMLDKYNCKILFNAEDGYGFPDHGCVDKSYLKKYAEANNTIEFDYYNNKAICDFKNQTNIRGKLENCPYLKSLNSGLFLAEREYLVEILETMLALMHDDPVKGFPYGELENQKMWQYLQSIQQNNEIEIDYFNLYFLWLHERKFHFPVDHWEHYDFFYRNYYNKTT